MKIVNRSAVSSARGVKGFLLNVGGDFVFRVYGKKGSFKDFKILHSDLAVTIDPGYEAALYPASENDEFDGYIDHEPEVLGYEI